MFSHYSLFSATSTIQDFAAIPNGDVASLIGSVAETYDAGDTARTHGVPVGQGCVWGDNVCVHPGGSQISMRIGKDPARQMTLILFTRQALREQRSELLAEGNHRSCEAACNALNS